MKRSLILILLVGICFGRESFKPKEGEGERISLGRASADIYWDEWGVPHIFAESFEALSYAFGYAQARDNGNTLARMFFFSSGKAAESSRNYEPIDQLFYSNRLNHFTDLYYKIQDPESVLALEAFSKGFNAFAERNPEFFDGDFAGILPLTGIKVFAANLRVLYTFAFASASATRSDFEKKFGKDPLMEKRLKEENVFYSVYEAKDFLSVLGVPDELRSLIGSNGWALNSQSGRTDGLPKLVQNPHLLYEGFFRWYEAQLVCESCGINVYGASLLGIPNLQIAFNDYLGWTHTVNPIQPYTTYIVDLASEDSYYYDGQILKITTEQFTYRVKQVIGYKEVTVTNEFTIHGQIISRAGGQVLVKRLAGFDDQIRPDSIKQWWDLGRAKSLSEFKEAMKQLQIPMFYTIVTTRDDDIMMNFNGWVPDRKGKGDYSYWSSPVNGSTSETFWTGIHAWEELPTLENPASGFVQNANEPPWTTTLPVFTLDPSKYISYIAPPVSISYRPQVSLRLMSSHTNITHDQLVSLKHSTFKEASFHSLDALLKAVEEFGQNSQDAKDGAAVLAQWDRQNEATSRGTDLFLDWLLRSSTRELYSNPWDPSDPLNTPNTLRDAPLAVKNLEAAVQNMRSQGIAIDSQYGDNNKIFKGPYSNREFLPGNGCDDCFRNTWFSGGLAVGGDSYVGVVEWDKNGVTKASSLIGYGNASPQSAGANQGHVNDQNELYLNKKLKPVWRKLEDILTHLEEHVPLQF